MILRERYETIVFSLLVILTKNILNTESHICTVQVSYQNKLQENCGWWIFNSWVKCTRDRTQYKPMKICCAGWKGTLCNQAICNGKTDPGACDGYFPNSHIKYSDGSIQKYVYGTCSSPNRCSCKKDGFYSTGPTCDMCSAIANCDLEVCKSKWDQTCRRCEGVVRDVAGYRAYKVSSNRRSCDKACSWRKDSTPCYPGSCSNELATNCSCTSGFSGSRCNIITNKPSITYNALTINDRSGGTKEAPGNINRGPPQNTVWTNIVNPSFLHYKFTADYRPVVPRTRPAYVTGFKVGIISGNVVIQRVRKFSTLRSTMTQQCPGSQSRTSPNQGMFTCEKTLPGISQLSPPFQHLDELRFTFSVSNGGFVEIENKETNLKEKRYMQGKETSNSYKMTFDTVSPYHCKLKSGCSSNMLSDLDLSTKAKNRFSWDGWKDDDAGIDYYNFEVFELKKLGNQLSISKIMIDAKTTNKYYDFNFPNPGVFSVILAAYDRAGNHKNARRLVIFDDSSLIDTIKGHFLRVTSALSATEYIWQNDLRSVTIDWTNRYINRKHINGGFLLGVEDDPAVVTGYDDTYGKRTTKAIDNVQGIQHFESVEKVYHLGDSTGLLPSANEYKDLKLKQQVTLTSELKDGDTLRYFVRAYDVLGIYKEENVTVHFDSSPPVIENLWLTKGDEVNLSVHGLAELDKMTIEWIAYDYHSGLEEVQWKIVDRVSDVEYGRQSISPQGESTSMEDCEEKYKKTTRGSDCYCSPNNKCFQRHFQIKPSRTTTECGDLNNATLHSEHDYHIVITVMNQAKLITTVTKKITIDTSPPVVGVVRDGKCGEPEVDFQSSLDIFAHWGGFTDRESDIRFYQYGFSTSCLDASRFDIDLQKTQNIGKTISTHAEWTAPGNGKYYVTVVAYNNAGEASTPVCSNGVIVTNSYTI